jgi:hypothetical protein
MTDLPASVRPTLRRLARRVSVGLFLEIWPRWAIGSFLIAGTAALVCRIFFSNASPFLPWLWLAPGLSIVPVIILCLRRAYRPLEIAALADSLSGGRGTLLTLLETRDPAWAQTAALEDLRQLQMPRLRPWRRLAPILASAAFLVTALLLPQRMITGPHSTVLANDIVADLQTTIEELKKQDLLTPEEQKNFEEEIERIRKDALDRVDASSWEAADTVREKVAATLNQKEDAVHWAQENLARYAAAAQAGTPPSAADSKELADAIKNLAQSGLLDDAPADLKQLLGSREALAGGNFKLPSDPKALRKLAQQLAKHLDGRDRGLAGIRQLGRDPGRFDASEFGEFNFEEGPDQDGDPGAGGINRGRGDADLTWGDESIPFDRFKSVALPPGAVRSPDDWAPVAALPGAPKEAAERTFSSTGMQFSGTAGQSAWRRTLAPRHYSAVKRYFENAESR